MTLLDVYLTITVVLEITLLLLVIEKTENAAMLVAAIIVGFMWPVLIIISIVSFLVPNNNLDKNDQ